jgi:hypothetical protein
MSTFYVLNVSRAHAPGELHVNSIPVETWDDDVASMASVVNEWIAGASSTVAFVPRMSQPPSPAADSRVEIAVASVVQTGTSEKTSTIVARLQWLPSTPATAGAVSTSFPSAPVPPSAFWPSARRISLDAPARLAMLALVSHLHAALRQRDLPTVTAILDFSTVDTGRAHYLSPESSRRSQTDLFSRHFARPDFRMEELVPDQVTLRLVADSRLVWITRQDLSPALQSAGAARFMVPLYAAPVNGRWSIVR